MILVKKVFIFSKTMIICLLCPLLCGLFFFWKGAKGELSYKAKKDLINQISSAWARRFELPAFWSVARRSIQLSYAHIFNCHIWQFRCYSHLNAADRNRTGTRFNSNRILSPARLPVPPLRHIHTLIIWHISGTNRTRTYDPLLVRQMLSQLSYDPKRLV